MTGCINIKDQMMRDLRQKAEEISSNYYKETREMAAEPIPQLPFKAQQDILVPPKLHGIELFTIGERFTEK